MRYLWKDIQTIVETYEGGLPLAHFLKNYFRLNHRLGSRDRKMLSEMAYAWYRSSKGFAGPPDFERTMGAALFLCSHLPHSGLFFPETWKEAHIAPATDRIVFLKNAGFDFDPERLFPFDIPFSAGMDRDEWLRSMLRQPRLFLRIRKNGTEIQKRLREAGIVFSLLGDGCLSLPNSAPVDKLLPAAWYVVQDYASQQTGQFFAPRKGEKWYDCCSGAGGKSLLLKDLEPGVQLTVSDIRESILNNLIERFRLYGHVTPTLTVLDLADAAKVQQKIGDRRFDGIICDVPCTGSGTWARTPEQLYFFKPSFLEEIRQRQQQILEHALPLLQPEGRLIYITCSVFRAENEAIVQAVAGQGYHTGPTQLINRMKEEADSLFACVLTGLG